MIKRDYDTMYDKTTGSTETHKAVDTKIKETIKHGSEVSEQTSYEEGFASASGVRPETAETGGRIKNPENKDTPKTGQITPPLEQENSGLADT
jgi:hypothetical protein